jgi:hypothetical protein
MLSYQKAKISHGIPYLFEIFRQALYCIREESTVSHSIVSNHQEMTELKSSVERQNPFSLSFNAIDSPGYFTSRRWLESVSGKETSGKGNAMKVAEQWNSVQRQQIGFQATGESVEGIKPGIQKPSSLPRCAIMASLL